MSHDLRQALGYRRLPTSDPRENDLRTKWYATRDEHGMESHQHRAVDRELTDYLWKRTQDLIEEDRKKHPKAKRNAPVGSRIGGEGEKTAPGGRALP